MNIAMVSLGNDYLGTVQMAKQLGVSHIVTGAGGKITDSGLDFAPFIKKLEMYANDGMKVSVIEGPTPLDKAKLGLDGRDQEIEIFFELMRIMAEHGVETVCYNWMPVVGWHRTVMDEPARGGALVTGYRHDAPENSVPTQYGVVTAERLWANMEYFLKAVVPVAEKYGIQLAVHPDDPPVESLKGFSRVLISADAMKKVTELVPSPMNGITLCQGCFATMGEDIISAINWFGSRKKLFFSHFRDVRGDRYHFYETFHDEGKTDMYRTMKEYYKVGFEGVLRPDHVPTMVGEKNDRPGYAALGNLFAVGYMRGLMEAAQKELGL